LGKTWKDIKKQDLKIYKKLSREEFTDCNLKTRVKPKIHKEKGGGKTWKEYLDNDNEQEVL
jgi:hypothetical protein